jgi:hypothetical protein
MAQVVGNVRNIIQLCNDSPDILESAPPPFPPVACPYVATSSTASGFGRRRGRAGGRGGPGGLRGERQEGYTTFWPRTRRSSVWPVPHGSRAPMGLLTFHSRQISGCSAQTIGDAHRGQGRAAGREP